MSSNFSMLQVDEVAQRTILYLSDTALNEPNLNNSRGMVMDQVCIYSHATKRALQKKPEQKRRNYGKKFSQKQTRVDTNKPHFKQRSNMPE